MNDNFTISKNSVIAFLILSAAMLSCCWALLGEKPFAQPVGGSTAAGFYIVATTASDNADPDLLWIANVETQQLVVYGTKADSTITPLASADLNRAFALRTVIPIP